MMQRGYRLLSRALPAQGQRPVTSMRMAQRSRQFSAQAENASAGSKESMQGAKDKAASALDKFPKHPDYEGVEAIFRYYMPHNYQVSKCICCAKSFMELHIMLDEKFGITATLIFIALTR